MLGSQINVLFVFFTCNSNSVINCELMLIIRKYYYNGINKHMK